MLFKVKHCNISVFRLIYFLILFFFDSKVMNFGWKIYSTHHLNPIGILVTQFYPAAVNRQNKFAVVSATVGWQERGEVVKWKSNM